MTTEITFSAMEKFYEEARKVRSAIRVYGGSFMRAIGNAMDMADIHNLHKIRDTWSKEWKQYLDMSKHIQIGE